jgi:hypothetical protein
LPRQECDELIAIFVTIINRAEDKLTSAFFLLPSAFSPRHFVVAASPRCDLRGLCVMPFSVRRSPFGVGR